MPEEAKHPFSSQKTSIFLKHVHQNLGHSGRSHTLSAIGGRSGLKMPT